MLRLIRKILISLRLPALFCCLAVLPVQLDAQQKNEALSQVLISNAFADYHYVQPASRKVLSLKKKKPIARYNPVNYLAAGMLFFYQRVVSEQFQANCMYEISCSEYTKRSIEYYGFVKGALLGFNQFSNCFPSVAAEHCEYKLTDDFKVKNPVEEDRK